MSRFQEIAEQYLDPQFRGAVEWMCHCPFCDGAKTLQFNIEKGLWVCFKCGEKGSAKRLVQRLGGQFIDPEVSTDFLHMQFDRLRTKLRHESQEDVEETTLPESALLRYAGPTHPYWKSRNFTEEAIQRWGLGYDPVHDRCTIPIREPDGSLRGVIERRLDDVFPRYIYPKSFDRNGTLFGAWDLPEGTTSVAMVEGSTDVISVSAAKRQALAQFGSSISARQLRLLRQLGITEIVAFYDYDEAGRKAVEDLQEKATGFLLYKVVWSKDKYCWHKKLCGCGEHTWRDIAKCEDKLLCRCGRQHEMDPGKLSHKEIRYMYDNPIRIGTREKKKWGTKKSAGSKVARSKRSREWKTQ